MNEQRKNRKSQRQLFPYVAMTGVFGALLFVTIFANPYTWMILPGLMTFPVTRQAEVSPDETWIAVVRDEETGDDWTFTVVLRPGAGWLGWWRQEKIFEVPSWSEDTRPKIRWIGVRELRVELPGVLHDKPRLQMEFYRDLHITYDIRYPARHD